MDDEPNRRQAGRIGPRCVALGVLLLTSASMLSEIAAAQNFTRSNGRGPYVHDIDVYDASGRRIDAASPGEPYSPSETCKKCHDVKGIAHGWHFNAAGDGEDGRGGEPWVLADARTGTQIPLSYREWPGVVSPDEVGLTPTGFAQLFGRHLPGGLDTYADGALEDPRRALTGGLEIDCMACHDASRTWSVERWNAQVEKQNFAWAPAAAMGLIAVDGDVSRLADGADPAEKRPTVRWSESAFDVEGKVSFDVVRTPPDGACLACHTVHPVGETAAPRWQHDGDVHTRAGLKCADCHRNGIEHHTVRGFPGEVHPSESDISSLTCAGCHMDPTDGHGRVLDRGGRLGAPLALHRGLPPVHLDKISCTACHSGSAPASAPAPVQTSMAHALGLGLQSRSDGDLPHIVEPVLQRDGDGKVRPYRAMWPSFWARRDGETLTPIAPADAQRPLRKALRVRRDLAAELGELEPDELEARVISALTGLDDGTGTPVRVGGGRVWEVAADGASLTSTEHPAAAPVLWPVAHDVRPARDSIGSGGCTDCHAADAPFLYQRVVAPDVLTIAEPLEQVAHERLGYDADLLRAWEASFTGRDAFKWVGFGALGLVALVLLVHLLVGLDAILRWLRGDRRQRGESEG
ncbi:MAG: hypothetical protein AAGI22_22050 [Planctomycetota bacterium]